MKPLAYLMFITVAIITFVFFWILPAEASYIEEMASYTSLSGKEILAKDIGMHTPYNAKNLIKTSKDPFGNSGMQVCSEINKDTAYFSAYDAQLTCMIIDMEKILGQIKTTKLLSTHDREVLMTRHARWIGETRFIKEVVTIPVFSECKEEDIFTKIKDMTLTQLLSLDKKD